ncbi:MAG TPA: c-type cytochrome [Pyrinomonadaceae bacterium]|nr:c-type cytochrome [Pyrinomonadaceae bacterium]
MTTKIRVSRSTCFIVVLSAMVCLAITTRISSVAASNDKQQTISSRKFSRSWQAQAVKTVDQTGKNIQVLKGLPESQLSQVMNFVAISLGVQCNFCHVQQGKDPTTGTTKWLWESDEKPQKQTARRMMQMVLSIKANNKVDFRENEVTCFTCHRGQRKPVGLPSMPLARSGHEPGPDDAALPAKPNLPSLDQIFSKYVEAVGGSAATNTRTLVLKGRREASQNRAWPNDITVASPNKFLLVTTLASATIRQILNGDKGWVVNGANVKPLSPAEALDATRRGNELFTVVKVKPSASMRLTGIQKVGEHETYVVENATDAMTERFYFDSQTGLLLRKVTLNNTVLMPFPEQVDFEDYREVDGVKMPFTIRYSGIDTYDSWVRTFTEIKRNAAVEDTLFVVPSPR